MRSPLQLILTVLLVLMGLGVTVCVGWYGWDYYGTSLMDRPFHPSYDQLKPSGFLGHGYGVIGTAMILLGVAAYSLRKRVRLFSSWGRISSHLQVHIFLCLIGPVLVLYHTTFKFGGLVAVSFWSMAAVVLSGVLGRYLYVQIPRGIKGNELSMTELEKEQRALDNELRERYHVSDGFLEHLNTLAAPPHPVRQMSLLGTLRYFAIDDMMRRMRLRRLVASVDGVGLARTPVARIRRVARRKLALSRRIAFLEQFRRLFFYWHVIHLPFALVMLVILMIHVGVAVAFGYTWIF